ncbi:hypothetical protein LIER_19926 [Lithospermum erythrorhizon]|uniref:MULE transposase domain-containing protein n=1 Tax=Lithospermum erythrorhizon TaxID=34254 RepID=A0AAV3QN88_LITER
METWKWFIQVLTENIEIVDEEDYVIMSDKQKRLQSVLAQILPRVEHRNCVQYIYKNFKRHHGSLLIRNTCWACARASTKAKHLAEIFDFKELAIDTAAYEWISNNASNHKHYVKISSL